MSVKIEENAAKGNPLKNGAKNWLLEHLPEEARTQFTNAVVPHTWKKLGALEPWANLTVDHVKEIVDEVFGKGTYQVERKGPWMGLVSFYSSLIRFSPTFCPGERSRSQLPQWFRQKCFQVDSPAY